MSAAVATGMPASDRRERLAGWGMATHATSWVLRPTTLDQTRDALRTARAHGASVALRGAGQSYGDAALNTDNVCVDLTRMNRVLAWDPATGLVTVEPGVTIGDLWRRTLADGWWPPVVPGTMAVTLGGAAAANVHGKNNWKAGPLGEHVRAFELLLPAGDVLAVTRERDPALFHAVLGGFGLLGCIVALTLQMKRVYSGLVDVEAVSAPSLPDMLAAFEERLARADYLVGWVDGTARGAGLGRGLVHAARHLGPGEDHAADRTLAIAQQDLPATFFGVLPKSIMWRLMKPFTGSAGTRLVNTVKYHQGRLQGRHAFRQSHAAFNFLLDYVPDWKRAYAPGGLIQYQTFVPAARAAETFAALLTRAQQRGLPPYLGVLKRHRADAFLLSHAVDGYSLALEFKVTAANRARLWALAAELDPLVLDAGGRFYFAKDSTLTAAAAARFLGAERLHAFRALKARCDPEGLLQTDLARRLALA